MDLERYRMLLFWGLLILVLGLCFALLFPFLHLIAWSVVLAIIAWPVHRRIARRVPHASVAALLSCFLVVVAVVLPMILVGAQIVHELSLLARNLQETGDGDFFHRIHPPELPAIQSASRWLERQVDLPRFNLEAAAQQAVGQASSYLAKQSVGIVRNMAAGILQAAVTMVTLFFFLRDGPRLSQILRAFLPFDDGQTDVLMHRMVDTIHATIYGAAVVAVTQGTLGGLAFWVLGLPSPLLWGATMTALCFIPFLGAPVVWIPAAATLVVQGAYGKAVALALWGMLVIGLVDNFLRPIVIGARTQMHPLLLFFSLLGGLLSFGPLGLLLAPAVMAVALALLDLLRVELRSRDATAPPLPMFESEPVGQHSSRGL